MNFWINLFLNILSVIILTIIGLLSLTYDSIKGRFTTIGWILLIVSATLYIWTTISDKIDQKKSESIYADENKNTRKQLNDIINILLNSYNSELKERAIQGYKETVNEEMTILKFESKLIKLESVLRSEVQKHNLLDIPIDASDSSTAFQASIFLQMINAFNEAKLISISLSNKLLEITKYCLLVIIDPSSITEETVKMVAATTQRFLEEIK